ncbi:hypothetical protein B484DRAFT_334694 [Ochromonadaceae sp. CCMP2298]|nr:hypothetical protein B484DRAFT_334694 [Ochromonadaceae sp. CCMP2298]
MKITLEVKFYNKPFYFKMKRSSPMLRLMLVFAAKVGHPMETLRFLLNGDRITELNTAQDLELKDHEVLDAVLGCYGG